MLNKLSVLKETELCGQQFAVYGTPQEPLFRAADVAKWINHSDVSKMIQKVDDDEKGTNIVRTPGGNQEVWFLTEENTINSKKVYIKVAYMRTFDYLCIAKQHQGGLTNRN